MRRVSMATRDELIEAVRERYRGGDRQDKSRILGEVCAGTGLHRKHVMRVLRASGRGRRRVMASAVKRAVAIRTFSDWHDPPPGFFEADLVAHSGPTTHGSFVQTLVLTDIATGWTECAPLLVREQVLLTRLLSELR